MKTFTTADLSRRIGNVTHAAGQAPISITHHSKPRYVMMTIERFADLNPQRAYRLDELPDDLAEELVDAIEAALKGKKKRKAA